MLPLFARAIVSAVVIVIVVEVSHRLPRIGAILLTLPVVSIVAFVLSWQRDHDLGAVSRLARETLVLVPLGLPFFVPLAFAERLGLGFWSASALGLSLAVATIGCWFFFGPQTA